MIGRLQVSHLRNINQIDMQTAKCNVIIGVNGSGKTSLLESIFLLSRGKSFRHHQPKRYIQHHQPAVTVHAHLTDGSTVAIQKQSDASTLLRLNQTTVYNQSILTEQLPTLLIDPSTMDMLEQGSASRRQLLDWLVFHMKQGFHPQWVAYQRLLKQRNTLLKQAKSLSQNQLAELKSWDQGLANHAALIDHYRQHIFTAWQPYFAASIAQLLPAYAQQLSLSYTAGYDTSIALDLQLSERLTQDLQLGYTRIGSHRADVHVHWRSDNSKQALDEISAVSSKTDLRVSTDIDTINSDIEQSIDPDFSKSAAKTSAQPILKEQAANVLSRGEKKLLITALRLSQLPLLLDNDKAIASSDKQGSIEASMTPVVLLDDITAELDSRALEILLATLATLPCQVFITSLTADILPMIDKYWPTSKVFHMKQGELTDY